MTGDVLSGGVVVALAAALWLAYLMPTWLRRREYEATERNAVRLQQTLRILAETAEVPREVRVEATAREVAVQQRILRKEEQRRLAEVAARTQAEVASKREEIGARRREAVGVDRVGNAARTRMRRLRRARACTSLGLLFGLGGVGFGVYLVATTASWMLLAGGVVLAASAVVLLGRLARAGQLTRAVAPAVRAVEESAVFDHAEHETPAQPVQTTWTPQPLPKPLHLSRGTIAASAMASVDAAAELRRAAARADLNRRAAELAPTAHPEIARMRPHRAEEPVVQPETPSRFAGMGVLNEIESDDLDLDAVLRRRRAAG